MNIETHDPTKKVIINKGIPGTIEVRIEHTIATDGTKGYVTSHTKIKPEEWHKILAFFKWTYDTTKSESQVRLFVNSNTQEWKAWAFPQKANTGMVAKELEEHERFAPQRAQFRDEDGWTYFGTVHHHCASAAFQSSTDEADERTKDGLHMTVGNLDKEKYTIHCRFYVGGIKFVVNMGWFWDIGNARDEVPAWAKEYLPKTDDFIARDQMCIPAPADTEFPQEWKDNLIVPPPVVHTPRVIVHDEQDWADWKGYNGNGHEPVSGYFQNKKPWLEAAEPGYGIDFDRCISDLGNYFKAVNTQYPGARPIGRDDVFMVIKTLQETFTDDDLNIVGFLVRHDVNPIKLALHWSRNAKDVGVIPDAKPNVVDGYPDKQAPGPGDHVTCMECGLNWPYHQRDCKNLDHKLIEKMEK